MSPAERIAVLAAASRAAGTKLADPACRADCAKVLWLQRDYAGARLLDGLSDAEYASIVAEVRGAPQAAPTPPGRPIDPDEV